MAVTTTMVSPYRLASASRTANKYMSASQIACRLLLGPTNARSKPFKVLAFTTPTTAVGVPPRRMIAVMASLYIKATGPDEGDSVSDDETELPESDDEPELELPFEELFLDSIEYKALMQRMKLKVPKYVKLRRKKLMHRRIRKKKTGGRTKANKLKKDE